MGLRQANVYVKGLADALEIEESALVELLAKNRSGGFARVWEINDEDKYATCRLSTNRKDGDNFIPDFSDGFVRFIGSAYEKIKDVEIPVNAHGKSMGVPIQILSCEATTFFSEKTESTYHNYAVFAFDFVEAKSSNKKSSKTSTKKTAKSEKATKTSKAKKKTEPEEVEDGDDLPF